MPGLFFRLIDIAWIVLGGVGASHVNLLSLGSRQGLDPLLVAFVAALALSVFPAFGAYTAQGTRSVVGLVSRTGLAWLAVQISGLMLYYVIHMELPSLPSFFYWTLASGSLLLVSHALAFNLFNFASSAGQWKWRTAGGGEIGVAEPSTHGAPSSIAWGQLVKRCLDVVVGASLIIMLSPLLSTLAIIVVLSDGGPAVFGHARVGRHGRKFRCLKFRSMIVNADQVLKHLLETDPEARAEWEREFKLKNDVRVTRIGRFLRRTSLDELPQLWNVVRGDMSLVGPRPIIDDELARYGADVQYYLQTKPGMTGLWQVSGRNSLDYATRVSLDVAYVKNWSLVWDVVILFRTFKVVFVGQGAY
jgi:lipopolysaccharide/colanic/teichoic acid biosynthesis glycosyltransferase